MNRYITTLTSSLLISLFITSINPLTSGLTTTHTTPLSLQEQINQAPSGSTIELTTSNYTEPLIITRPLHLKGNGTHPTPLQITSQPNSYALWINAENVTLSNLTLSNTASGLYTTAIKISAPHTTIQNCTIHDTPIGIAIWSSQTTITHCQFSTCDDEGIVLLGTPNRPCTNTTITDCTFQQNCDGIELQYTSHTTISYCAFTDNTHAGIDAIGSNHTYITITQCTFDQNQGFGVYLHRTTHTTITDSVFHHNTITTYDATENTLRNNTDAPLQQLQVQTISPVDLYGTVDYSNQQTSQHPPPHQTSQPTQEDNERTTTQPYTFRVLHTILMRIQTILTYVEHFQHSPM
jgi:parallel beta-helix repeat protein